MKNAPLLLECEARVLGGRYRVRRLLGRGGMADVFLGDDLLLDREVAIKILQPSFVSDAVGLERFRREAMTLARVRSPHVVGIYDIGVDDELAYLVMQYIEGQTLEQVIARSGPMSRARTKVLLAQLLDGLAEMHSQGLVHRDITPSNIVLDGGDQVVLLDLGIVLDLRRPALTAPGMVAGTPGFVAPEECPHTASAAASDVYQVGLLMLFLMTGVDIGRRAPSDDFEDLLRKLPASLAAIARCALATAPSDRFPSAALMKEAVIADVDLPIIDDIDPPTQRVRRSRAAQAPIGKPVPEGARSTTELTAAQLVSLLIEAAPTRGDLLPEPPIPTPEPRASGTERPTHRLRGPHTRVPRGTILIVDEDLPFRATLQRMLAPAHDVHAVDERQAVSEIAAGKTADVILCGLKTPMPFHNVVMRRRPDQAAKIIFLIANVVSREARAFMTKVTNTTLGKPFEISFLKDLIDKKLSTWK